MKIKSNIRTLSSLIVESINEKSLDRDYCKLLEICRNEKISSYTLNLMIDCAVSSLQHDSQIKCINTSPNFGWKIKENFLPKPEVKEIVRTRNINTFIYRWGWKTWGLFLTFIIFLCYIVYRIICSPFLQMELFGKILI